MDEATKQLMKEIADAQAREKAAAKAAGQKRKATAASSSAIPAKPVTTIPPPEVGQALEVADPTGGGKSTGASSPVEPEEPPPKKAKKAKGEAGPSGSKKDKKKKKKKKKKNSDVDEDDARVGMEAEGTDAGEGDQAGQELGEAGGAAQVVISITDSDSIQDDRVVRRYVEDMFTNTDWDRLVEMFDRRQRNPFRILQSLGLEMLLVSRGLEARNHDTVQEVRRLTGELQMAEKDAASASTRADKAIEQARSEVAKEVGELKGKLEEAESSKSRAEHLAKEANDANLQLRSQLIKVQAELERAQKEAEDSRSESAKEMSDLRGQLAEFEKKLQDEGPKAVAEYLASRDFSLAKARASVPAYTMGLQAYREVLVSTHPDWDLSQMDELMPASLPDDMEDAPTEGGGEGAAEEVAPAVDPSQGESEVQTQDGVAAEEVVDLTTEPSGVEPGVGEADAEA